VNALYEKAPTTAADWLALDTEHPSASRSQPLDCGPPEAPEGFELYELDQFGAAGVVAMTASIDVIDLDLAGELVADAFALYVTQGADEPAAAPVVGVWRLRFRVTDGAMRFAALFENRGVDLRRLGSEVVIRVRSDAASDVLSDAELATCPELAELKPTHAAASPANAALKRFRH
jgi:hypothetical protein